MERLGPGADDRVSVWLNGQSSEIDSALTIAQLAAKLGLAPNAVLIEHNGIALHPREWRDRAVEPGDRIEFVRVVAGG